LQNAQRRCTKRKRRKALSLTLPYYCINKTAPSFITLYKPYSCKTIKSENFMIYGIMSHTCLLAPLYRAIVSFAELWRPQCVNQWGRWAIFRSQLRQTQIR